MQARLLATARLGLAHWFFGNLYEEIVRMPQRVADAPGAGGPLGPGSPVRYYLPAAPLTLAATFAAIASGWGDREDRPRLVAAGLLTTAGAAMTAHLVRAVNLRLLGDAVPDNGERRRLVAHWHRVNRVRLVMVAGAALALGRRLRSE